MKILTFVKHVPTSAVTPRIAEGGARIEDSGLAHEANEADLYAIEEAIHQKNTHGGEVIAASIGPERAKEALHMALAKGVDQVLHVLDEQFQGTRASVNIAAAAKVAEKHTPDLILCGVQAEDDLQGQFGIMLGEALGLPVITAVTEININAEGSLATVIREIGAGFKEELEVDLPAVLTIQFGIRPLRYTPIMAIVRMRRHPVEATDFAALGISAEATGGEDDLRVIELRLPEAGGQCQLIEGAPDEAAGELVRRLIEQGALQDAG